MATISLSPQEKKSKFIDVLTSPKTTLALGTLLIPAGRVVKPAVKVAGKVAPKVLPIAKKVGVSVGKALFGTPKKAMISVTALPTAVGVLATSPTAREVLKTGLSPVESFKRGERFGETIEGKPTGIREKVVDIAKTGGLIAGGVALAGAGVLAVEKIGKITKKDAPTINQPQAPAIQRDETAPIQTRVTTPSEVKRKRRKSIKRETPSIRQSQRTNVYVSNKMIHKLRY